mgnify:CR=1 FL=1
MFFFFLFFQAKEGIRDLVRSRGLGDVYKRQPLDDNHQSRHHHPADLNDPSQVVPCSWRSPGSFQLAHDTFGWVKTVGAGRKLRYVGQDKNRAWFKMTTAVYNLIRITALDTEMAPA